MAKVDIPGVGGADVSMKEIAILVTILAGIIYILPKLAGHVVKDTISTTANLISNGAKAVTDPKNPVNSAFDTFYQGVTGSDGNLGGDVYSILHGDWSQVGK